MCAMMNNFCPPIDLLRKKRGGKQTLEGMKADMYNIIVILWLLIGGGSEIVKA